MGDDKQNLQEIGLDIHFQDSHFLFSFIMGYSGKLVPFTKNVLAWNIRPNHIKSNGTGFLITIIFNGIIQFYLINSYTIFIVSTTYLKK